MIINRLTKLADGFANNERHRPTPTSRGHSLSRFPMRSWAKLTMTRIYIYSISRLQVQRVSVGVVPPPGRHPCAVAKSSHHPAAAVFRSTLVFRIRHRAIYPSCCRGSVAGRPGRAWSTETQNALPDATPGSEAPGGADSDESRLAASSSRLVGRQRLPQPGPRSVLDRAVACMPAEA